MYVALMSLSGNADCPECSPNAKVKVFGTASCNTCTSQKEERCRCEGDINHADYDQTTMFLPPTIVLVG